MNEPATHQRAQQLLGEGMRAWRLLRDPRTPTAFKLIPALGLLYVLFPLDLVPDLIPGAGQLDDVAILLIALRLFLQLAGPERQAGGPTAEDTASAPARGAWFGWSPGQPSGAAPTGSRAEPDVVTTTYRVQKD